MTEEERLTKAETLLEELGRQQGEHKKKIEGFEKIKYMAIGVASVLSALGVYSFYLNLSLNQKKYIDALDEHTEEKIKEINANTGLDSIYTFFLTGSTIWFNSGVKVERGEHYDFFISGSTNSSLNTIAYDHLDYKELEYPWTHFPPINNDQSTAHNRNETLIWPEADYRDIIIAVIDDRETIERLNKKPELLKTKEEQFRGAVSVIGPKDNSWNEPYSITMPASGFLFLTINENYLSEMKNFTTDRWKIPQKIAKYQSIHNDPENQKRLSAKDYSKYIFRHKKNFPKDINQWESWEEGIWNSGKDKDKFKRILYDDNIGGYLITVQKRR